MQQQVCSVLLKSWFLDRFIGARRPMRCQTSTCLTGTSPMVRSVYRSCKYCISFIHQLVQCHSSSSHEVMERQLLLFVNGVTFCDDWPGLSWIRLLDLLLSPLLNLNSSLPISFSLSLSLSLSLSKSKKKKKKKKKKKEKINKKKKKK